jgi:ubiquinone/menaquinone biosynthesis C-methylase UbiE
MNYYNSIAMFYDKLTEDVDYKKRADYFLSLFELYDKKPTLMLDAACGSGLMSVEFAEKGIEVIGVDHSPNMLAKAQENASSRNCDILFLHQDITKLDLYGTVDGAICTLDSINHLKGKRAVEKFFKSVSLFLEDNRLFIFDINTEYKHREILGNNYFEFEENGVNCRWQNKYYNRNNKVKIKLLFTEHDESYIEKITEYAYSIDLVKKMLKKNGLETIAIFDDMTQNPPMEKSQRIIFVTRKGKNNG